MEDRGIHWLHVQQMITDKEFMETDGWNGNTLTACSENDYWQRIHGNWWMAGEYTDCMFRKWLLTKNSWKLMEDRGIHWLHVQKMITDKEFMETYGRQGNTLTACSADDYWHRIHGNRWMTGEYTTCSADSYWQRIHGN